MVKEKGKCLLPTNFSVNSRLAYGAMDIGSGWLSMLRLFSHLDVTVSQGFIRRHLPQIMVEVGKHVEAAAAETCKAALANELALEIAAEANERLKAVGAVE